MNPVLRGEIIEGEEDVFVFFEAFAGFWVLRSVELQELFVGFAGILPRLSLVHFVEQLLGRWLRLLGQFFSTFALLCIQPC
ncbi:MAG: hypothetical protein O3B01_13745 [Planctomycetota bacterium]|nr:hypothetical protein [Planctomycetota bacterium]